MLDKNSDTTHNDDNHESNPMDLVKTKPVPVKEERSGDKNKEYGNH